MLTAPVIVIDGATLTPAAVDAVARRGRAVELAPAARQRNLDAREAIAALLERGEALYGATTGVGALRDRVIGDAERERFQWNLLRSHAVSAGRPLAPELVRAGMVVRANQLGAGGAGTAPALLDGLLAALNDGVTPLTRELGSLGTGDLPGLAEIALALLGEGQVWRDGELVDAPVRADPVELGLRDALGFMSSNAMTAGHAALLSVDARALHERWLEVAALSFEALDADPVVLDARVQAGRGARGQAAVAERMRELLAGAPFDPRAPDRLVQDPYPFRVLAPGGRRRERRAADARRRARPRAQRAPRERPDRRGSGLPDRQFPCGRARGRARWTARSVRALGVADRGPGERDPRSEDERPDAVPRRRPGPDSGHMMLEYTAHAAAAEARSLASPMAAQSVWASLGVESHASLAATAAARTAELIHAMGVLVATEMVVAVRALRFAGREPAGMGVRALFDAAAQALPADLEDRAFGHDVEAALKVLEISTA